MSMLSQQAKALRSWADQLAEREDELGVVVRALVADLREAADTIESLQEELQKEDDILRDYRAEQIATEAERRLQESYGQVPEQEKRGNEDERESYATQECHATQPNYEHCKYSTNRGWRDVSRYAELFGTPERTAQTLEDACFYCDGKLACDDCVVGKMRGFRDTKDEVEEWLRGDAE